MAQAIPQGLNGPFRPSAQSFVTMSLQDRDRLIDHIKQQDPSKSVREILGNVHTSEFRDMVGISLADYTSAYDKYGRGAPAPALPVPNNGNVISRFAQNHFSKTLGLATVGLVSTAIVAKQIASATMSAAQPYTDALVEQASIVAGGIGTVANGIANAANWTMDIVSSGVAAGQPYAQAVVDGVREVPAVAGSAWNATSTTFNNVIETVQPYAQATADGIGVASTFATTPITEETYFGVPITPLNVACVACIVGGTAYVTYKIAPPSYVLPGMPI